MNARIAKNMFIGLLMVSSSLCFGIDSKQVLVQGKAEMEWEPNKPPATRSWGNLPKAKSLLETIPASAPEYPEAQSLLKEIASRTKQMEKIQMSAAPGLEADERTQFAKTVEMALIALLSCHVGTTLDCHKTKG
ncbi:MAG: hypothetical protein WCL27_11520 [Betaproteobacteria bacterium]